MLGSRASRADWAKVGLVSRNTRRTAGTREPRSDRIIYDSFRDNTFSFCCIRYNLGPLVRPGLSLSFACHMRHDQANFVVVVFFPERNEDWLEPLGALPAGGLGDEVVGRLVDPE